VSTQTRYVPLAAVARPHGVAGEVRLKLYNLDSDLLLKKPPIRLRLSDGKERDARILAARAVDRALLVRIDGVDDRNAAEALRGAELCVPRESFPALEDGEFYACDIEGARVILAASDEEIGRVVELRSYPTCDVLVVARKAKGADLEIPLLDAYVERVDAAAGVIRVITIEGL
jgi:16S rRNA processing protein RimM